MDERLYGSAELGDQSFRYCVKLLEAVLDYATEKVSAKVSCLSSVRNYALTLQQKLSLILRHFPAGVDIAFWDHDKPAEKHGLKLSIESLVDGERVKGELQYNPQRECELR